MDELEDTGLRIKVRNSAFNGGQGEILTWTGMAMQGPNLNKEITQWAVQKCHVFSSVMFGLL